MLSDMGRLGYVKIYLRLGVGGDSLGRVRRRKETPAGGRGGGVVFRSSAPFVPSRLRPSAVQAPLRRPRRRGPSAGTSDCFPSRRFDPRPRVSSQEAGLLIGFNPWHAQSRYLGLVPRVEGQMHVVRN